MCYLAVLEVRSAKQVLKATVEVEQCLQEAPREKSLPFLCHERPPTPLKAPPARPSSLCVELLSDCDPFVSLLLGFLVTIFTPPAPVTQIIHDYLPISRSLI